MMFAANSLIQHSKDKTGWTGHLILILSERFWRPLFQEELMNFLTTLLLLASSLQI